jgi:nuclear pore complex protein Nup133
LQLYISNDNKDAGPFDFKKALDLLEYVDIPEEKNELRRSIWCQAVLRDDWDNLNTDYPMETCKTMIFCQLFELLGLTGTF